MFYIISTKRPQSGFGELTKITNLELVKLLDDLKFSALTSR